MVDSVRMKVRMSSITRMLGSVKQPDGSYNAGVTQNLTMFPVTGGSEEDDKFFAATPSGRIELGTVNEEAASFFDIDGLYYVTFTRA